MNKPDLVLFDCDGVLVDSEHITSSVLQDDLARHGLIIPNAEIDALFVGGTMAGVMHTARSMGATLSDDWLDHIYGRVFLALGKLCKPIPGIEGALDALDEAGIPYAIGSNGPLAKMDVTLRCTGLWSRFEGRVYSAHDCAASKPAPDVYLKAAADAGIAPTRCAVIEDSATGARAGVAAGMPVFGYARGGSREKLAPHCIALFDDMSQLAGLLRL
ncbi:MAG: HAD family phosphatase [Sulfitobacter sp.]